MFRTSGRQDVLVSASGGHLAGLNPSCAVAQFTEEYGSDEVIGKNGTGDKKKGPMWTFMFGFVAAQPHASRARRLLGLGCPLLLFLLYIMLIRSIM